MVLVLHVCRVQNAVPLPWCSRRATEALTPLPTVEYRGREGSDITDPSLVSESLGTPDNDSSLTAKMFHMLGVTLSCLLCACPVFVAGTRREISFSSIDKPGILTQFFHSISGVHIRIVQQLCLVPFCSRFYTFPSTATTSMVFPL